MKRWLRYIDIVIKGKKNTEKNSQWLPFLRYER